MAGQLNITDRLQVGQTYTFNFMDTGVNPFVGPQDIAADITNGVDYVDNVNVNQGVGPYYVQLTYNGDGSDTVDSLASDIVNIVNNNHTLFTFSFVSASAGLANPGTITMSDVKSVAQGAGQAAAEVLPDTTTLIVIVVGIALIAFIMSGGPSIIREST